jgi:3-deoxy-D-manno-octulosonate 8-phosphate phosphatase (KDO 8-P phosphatase)
MNPSLRKKLARVRLFLCDVDGVLTDGAVWMGGGVESKRFHIRDGLGMKFLQRFGIKIGWVSRRPSDATVQRAQDLKIDFLQQIDGDKVAAVERLLQQHGFTWEETCFMGDDVVDLGVLKRVGVAAVVADGIQEARRLADYVTRARGGHGAVREVVDLLLKAQGKWSLLLKDHLA